MLPLKISFQSHARKFACTAFHIGGFLFVQYGHKASWFFLAAYFLFCWLLISFPLLHLFCIALSSPWLGKRGLIYMSLSISEPVYLYAPTYAFAIWRYAKGNMWFIMFTLHHHHCNFVTDMDLRHRWYTNLIIYIKKETRLNSKIQCMNLSMKHAIKQTASLCM